MTRTPHRARYRLPEHGGGEHVCSRAVSRLGEDASLRSTSCIVPLEVASDHRSRTLSRSRAPSAAVATRPPPPLSP